MENLDRFNIIALFDAYKSLLTDRQQSVLSLYLLSDLGLTEIGENLKISRQAVLDAIKKSETILFETEKNLKLVERSRKISKLLDSIMVKNESDKEIIKQIKDLI